MPSYTLTFAYMSHERSGRLILTNNETSEVVMNAVVAPPIDYPLEVRYLPDIHCQLIDYVLPNGFDFYYKTYGKQFLSLKNHADDISGFLSIIKKEPFVYGMKGLKGDLKGTRELMTMSGDDWDFLANVIGNSKDKISFKVEKKLFMLGTKEVHSDEITWRQYIYPSENEAYRLRMNQQNQETIPKVPPIDKISPSSSSTKSPTKEEQMLVDIFLQEVASLESDAPAESLDELGTQTASWTKPSAVPKDE